MRSSVNQSAHIREGKLKLREGGGRGGCLGGRGRRGEGAKFDSRSQLAPRIQDALGRMGERGAERARQR